MRLRLTLVYGGLLLVAGIVLLGVTYALVSQRLPTGDMVFRAQLPSAVLGPGGEPQLIQKFAAETRDSALNTVLTQGGIALAVVSAAAIALGWLIAGRLLQPLHRITDTARRIAYAPAGGEGLHERIALAGPNDEIKRLADTFDLMLARLDQSFDGQRRFIANASHELRTPLTLNRTLLEVALSPESVSPEVRQLGTTLLAINDRHARLIDGLLVLAQSERVVVERSYVDLADIVHHVAADADLDVHEAPTLGDPVLLERLVQNLVENGRRHNVPDGGWVRVRTGAWDASVFLEVSNSGPLIPPYEVPSLFEPFRRLGADRVSGSAGAGLGLSIVRAVAHAHGGSARADARPEGGLIVTVTLPRAP
ncbi:MAG TPA: ATP-binding protein [Actinoplanes sp.]|nr:ATP-binding protein [Actinoplanes sp.]